MTAVTMLPRPCERVNHHEQFHNVVVDRLTVDWMTNTSIPLTFS
jgi:hypothetical protein